MTSNKMHLIEVERKSLNISIPSQVVHSVTHTSAYNTEIVQSSKFS